MSAQRAAQENGAGAPAGDAIWPYLTFALRWRRALIIVPLVAAVGVAGLSVAMSRKYQSVASFIPQDAKSGGSSGALGAIAAQFGVSQLASLATSSGGAAASPFYAALLDSREILHNVVVAHYTLDQLHHFSGTLVEYYKVKAPTPIEAELRTMKRLKTRILDIATDRTTGVVTVKVTTDDPQLTAAIGARLFDLLDAFNQRRRQSQASAERDFSDERLADAQNDLQKAESALADFELRNRSIAESPRLELDRANLQRRITIAQQLYLTLAQQFDQARIEAVRNTPLVTVIDSPGDLVEPVPRQTVLKAIFAAFVAVFLVTVWGLLAEQISRSRTAGTPAYEEYRRLRGLSAEERSTVDRP
jgi:uncharacterized protein involved in exopolysaccharide biosynthesis